MSKIKKIKEYYNWGGRFLTNSHIIEGTYFNDVEICKQPLRTTNINYLIKTFNRECNYLEIGVRNPSDNFDKVLSTNKFSVDPGVEFIDNPVDFKMTSDVFFDKLKNNQILSSDIKFDVIFIDGLHLANQVDRDIFNSLEFLSDDGFIVLHDCNPPSEWHSRECYNFDLTPARQFWNGTTWKAFVNYRKRNDLFSCCIDSDWGIGIINKKIKFGTPNEVENPYYEFEIFKRYKTESLNLMTFEEMQKFIEN